MTIMGKSRLHLLPLLMVIFLAIGVSARMNRTALTRLLKPAFVPPKLPLSPNAQKYTLGKIYIQAFESFQRFYTEAVAMVNETLDEAFENELENSEKIASCEANDVQPCYVGTTAENLQAEDFISLVPTIADTLVNLFCKPLGFRFEDYFGKKTIHPMWMNFQLFWLKFQEEKESFSNSQLIEAWLSNVFMLSKSPLYFYSSLMGSISEEFSEDFGDQLAQWTPSIFAGKCTSSPFSSYKYAARLLKAGQKKGYIFDVLLHGLFTLRSANYYISGGGFESYTGAMLAGLDVGLGRKCGLVMDNGEESEGGGSCDDIGRYPFTQHPVPRSAEHTLPETPDCIF